MGQAQKGCLDTRLVAIVSERQLGNHLHAVASFFYKGF